MKLTRRLTWTGWCGVAGVVIFAVLLALSATRWVVNRHLLLARGKLSPGASYGQISIKNALPESVSSEVKDVDTDTLKAIVIHDDNTRLKALEALSNAYPKDVFVQCVLARHAACINDGWPLGEISKEDCAFRSRLLIMAATRGQVLQPDNAFFGITEAIGQFIVGNKAQARATLIKASEKTDYREGLKRETNLLQTWYRSKVFLGYAFESELLSHRRDPQLMHLCLITHDIRMTEAGHELTQARLAVMKLADLAGRKSDYEYGLLFATGSANRALNRRNSKTSSSTSKDLEAIDKARELQGVAISMGLDTSRFDLVASMQAHLDRAKRLKETQKADEEGHFANVPFWLFGGSGLLVTLIALFPVVGLMKLGQLRWKNPNAELAVPLLWILGFTIYIYTEKPSLFTTFSTDYFLLIQLVLIIAALVASFIPRFRSRVLVLVGALIVIGFLQGGLEYAYHSEWLWRDPSVNGEIPAFAVSIGTLLVLLLSRLSRPNWLLWTISVVQIVGISAVIGEWVILNSVHELFALPSPPYLPLAVLLCFALTLAPRPQVRLHRLIGPILLVGFLVYTGSVIGERFEDHKYARFTEQDLSRADRVRAAMP